MKIAVVVGEFPKLSETFVLQQITGLLDLGHDVTVFAFRDSSEDVQHRAVSQYRLRERTRYLNGGDWRALVRGLPATVRDVLRRPHIVRNGSAFKQRLAVGAQRDFDVIYCHFGHVADQARQLRAAGLFSGPLVAVFHGFDVAVWPTQVQGPGYAPLFREAARLLPISEFWRDRLVAMGADPQKIEVRRMGVNCRELRFRPRSLGDTGPVQLVSVGRLVEKKGLAFGIRAVARARRQLNRELNYHIVGDGPLRAELAEVARSEGVAGQVTFHGARRADEIVELLEGMQILLTPSVTAANGDMEGLPVVLMEGMAQGLPVVSTIHSGIPELVRAGQTGFLVPERDADALAAALISLVTSPGEWLRLTTNARALIEAEFDAHRLTEQLAELLKRVSTSR